MRYVESLRWQKGWLDESCYNAALRAASLGINQDLVLEVLTELVADAGDIPKQGKIWSQIERAAQYATGATTATLMGQEEIQAHAHGGMTPKRTKAPAPKAAFDPAKLDLIAAKCVMPEIEKFITAASPICADYATAADFLAHLFYASEKVVVFTTFESQGQLVWQRNRYPRQSLPHGGPDGVWFLANPVDGKYHPNPRQCGKPSRRSEESVTSFRFAVLESDEADATQWLKMLVQLPLEISAIYTSGGRSIHTLIRVDASNKAEWDQSVVPVKGWLTTLGADPGALTAVRLSRLPQTYRGERLQQLLYLDPNPDGVPICQKRPRPSYQDWLQWAQAVVRWRGEVDEANVRACSDQLAPFRSDPVVVDAIDRLSRLVAGGET